MEGTAAGRSPGQACLRPPGLQCWPSYSCPHNPKAALRRPSNVTLGGSPKTHAERPEKTQSAPPRVLGAAWAECSAPGGQEGCADMKPWAGCQSGLHTIGTVHSPCPPGLLTARLRPHSQLGEAGLVQAQLHLASFPHVFSEHLPCQTLGPQQTVPGYEKCAVPRCLGSLLPVFLTGPGLPLRCPCVPSGAGRLWFPSFPQSPDDPGVSTLVCSVS